MGETYIFRYCPAGTFTMGSPESERYRPLDETQHSVTLTKGFRILDTEVTQAMWITVTGQRPMAEIADLLDDWIGPNKPVGQITWNDCQDFILTLNTGGYV